MYLRMIRFYLFLQVVARKQSNQLGRTLSVFGQVCIESLAANFRQCWERGFLSLLSSPGQSACVPPLHTHTRTHARTHARTHTHFLEEPV